MYEQKLWQDHVTEFEDRYTESRNDDGTITHTPLEVLLKLEPRIGTASPLLTAYSHNIKSRCYPAFYQSYFAALPFPEVLPFSDL